MPQLHMLAPRPFMGNCSARMLRLQGESLQAKGAVKIHRTLCASQNRTLLHDIEEETVVVVVDAQCPMRCGR